MPAMMADTTTLEEEMTNMKVILNNLTRENEEKKARIKLQEKRLLS